LKNNAGQEIFFFFFFWQDSRSKKQNKTKQKKTIGDTYTQSARMIDRPMHTFGDKPLPPPLYTAHRHPPLPPATIHYPLSTIHTMRTLPQARTTSTPKTTQHNEKAPPTTPEREENGNFKNKAERKAEIKEKEKEHRKHDHFF
jgi:hypothetical protein